MNILRKLLFPFSIIYWFITSIRNFLYNQNIFKSYSFSIPIIAVGNLNVGGTGKTPQIEYLIRLLSNDYKVATLSRGYKRKSKGFILANSSSNSQILGDEPFQFYKKFPNIQVAVDADRKNGIEQLLSQSIKPDVILLDDAFQHRKVKAGFYILLTSYNDLFVDDWILPVGNLRESRLGVKRANSIIVTKCPKDISIENQEVIRRKLNLQNHQTLFFSNIEYDDFVYSNTKKLTLEEVRVENKILLTGIAKPASFFAYLQSEKDECLEFPDHHDFSEKDINNIKNKSKNKIIITTEKDFVRLNNKLKTDNFYYLPIKSKFVNNAIDFDTTIKNYVGTSSRIS